MRVAAAQHPTNWVLRPSARIPQAARHVLSAETTSYVVLCCLLGLTLGI